MRLTTVTTLAAILLSMAFGLSACSHSDKHDHDDHHSEESEAEEHSSGDIFLDSARAKAANVETTILSPTVFHDVIKASGSIVAASCDETTVVAPTNGIVSHSRHISEGIALRRGEVLYHIASDKLKDGDYAQRTRINYLAAKREYDRTLPLVQEKIITEKEFNAIRTEYENARIAYDAIKSAASPKGITITSPVTGYMKECLVKDGDYVETGAPLMVVTRNQHLYLRAEVPIRYYNELGKISTAKFRTQYSDRIIDLKNVHGQLMSSGKSAVSTSSYIPVTFQLDNTGGIVAGAYAEIFLVTGERRGVLSVPATALTEEQGIFYVYIQTDHSHYHKQEVALGATDGEYTEITSGLKGGERIVTKGAVTIKLAATRNAIPAHTHEP